MIGKLTASQGIGVSLRISFQAYLFFPLVLALVLRVYYALVYVGLSSWQLVCMYEFTGDVDTHY